MRLSFFFSSRAKRDNTQYGGQGKPNALTAAATAAAAAAQQQRSM